MSDLVQRLRAECERAIQETPPEFEPTLSVYIQRPLRREQRTTHLFEFGTGPIGTIMDWDRKRSLVFFDPREVLEWLVQFSK